MIIIEINGGLGNQMFQYAFYRYVKSKRDDVKCYIKNSKFGNRQFKLDIFEGIDIDRASWIEYSIMRKVIIPNGNIFDILVDKLKIKENVYIEDENKLIDVEKLDNVIVRGYFQNIDYIRPVEQELRKHYRFPVSLDMKKKIKEIVGDNTASVHIRRGDYLKFKDIYGGICTDQYYKKALAYLDKNGIEQFEIFSDEDTEMSWMKNYRIKKFKKDNFNIADDWFDMYLMSQFKGNIIANSTFSWWAAWLNDNDNKFVVCPSKFDNNTIKKNLYYSDYIIIDTSESPL